MNEFCLNLSYILLAVKLLAVVKYIRSARKFEACSSISFYLDQLREHFIETADRLVELSRQDVSAVC